MIDINLSKNNQTLNYQPKTQFNSAKNILITGASSGIGQSLAIACANKGKTLFLWGRSQEKLDRTAQLCLNKGAKVQIFSIDLADSKNSLRQLETLLINYTIDMAIMAAGSGDIREDKNNLESDELLLKLMHLNYVTPCVMGNKIAQQMIDRGIYGQLVFVGSVAAFHSLPFATAYSSSKAGLSRFVDSLRISVKKWNIKITLITPGFVDTPMSQRLECNKPFMISLETATQKIIKAVNEEKAELIMPKLFVYLKWIDLVMPNRLKDFILSHLRVKQS